MSKLFFVNILLALTWCAAFGDFSPGSLIAGFVIGAGVLWVTRPLYGDTAYFGRALRVVRLVLVFLVELVVSSLRVAWNVLTPRELSHPAIIRVPLDARSNLEITLLANMVSLTPGTLSLEVSPDRRFLYVHAMFAEDPQAVVDDIKSGMEKALLEVTR